MTLDVTSISSSKASSLGPPYHIVIDGHGPLVETGGTGNIDVVAIDDGAGI